MMPNKTPRKRTSFKNSAKFIADENPNAKADADVVIIGAGVAGASLASYLGENGKKVIVVERDLSEPHRIVGELLQPRGVQKLEEMGLDKCLDGYDSQTVVGYGIYMHGDPFEITYAPRKDGTPDLGRSFHHGKFIMALREKAAECKNVELRTGNVQKLTTSGKHVNGVQYTVDDTKKIVRAPLTVVCDGCFSMFRDPLSDSKVKIQSRFVGLVLKDCEPPFANKGCVILSKPSPTLVYPISSSEVRILIDFPGDLPNIKDGSMSKHMREVIKPQLPVCVQESFENAITEGKYMSMPNRVLHARPELVDGVALLGDSLNMRHPLTGGGMTVAFTDVKHLGDKIIGVTNMNDLQSVTNAVDKYYATRNPPSTVINILASALYEVFCDDELGDACYAYLKKGGKYSAGPLSMLAGVNSKQSFLISHFFAVAFYGTLRTLKPFPTPSKIVKAVRIIRRATQIIMPLIEQEHNSLPVTIACRTARLALWC
jgi:squalene monooxygenase